jgi:predicted acylesterase/phospholipase RssA
VGVFKALEEAGVPVDTVGGTSMGAIFAGGIAMQWSADEIMEEVRSLFGPRLALYDPTIPLRALLAGKKLDGVMARLFQDLSIADLMIPFFCVATNISRAHPEVFDSGAMRDAIRSSCSIPGLFPPVRSVERVLVDGGLMNNLPFGVMRQRCPGPIVAVNVFPYRHDEQKKNGAGHDGQTSSRVGPLDRVRDLRGRMRSKLKLVEVPLFDTLVRASFVGSQHADEASLSAHPPALYLAPDVTKLRILDWRSYDAFFRIGYECAKRSLDAGALPRSLWEGPVVRESA